MYAWLLVWTSDGLYTRFSSDDMQNLSWAWDSGWADLLAASVAPWSQVYRPTGGLFYLALFDLFGFDPFPFRVAVFVLLGLNAWLLYRLALSLGAGPLGAFCAATLAAYHGRLMGLYADTGRIYDVLAATFALLCFLAYFSIPGRRRLILASLALVLALNAKEIAVAAPAALLAYELGTLVRRRFEGLRYAIPKTVWALVSLAAISASAALLPGSRLHQHPAYTPEISFARAMENLNGYWSNQLYQPYRSLDELFLAALVLLFAALPLLRFAPASLGAALALLGLGPIAFIDERDFGAAYVPSMGWNLLAGACFGAAVDAAVRHFAAPSPISQGVRLATAILAASLTAYLLSIDRARTPGPEERNTSLPGLESFRAELIGLAPTPPPNARVRFVSNPFNYDWMPLFVTKLTYRAREMHIEIDGVSRPAVDLDREAFDLVFDYQGGTLVRLR